MADPEVLFELHRVPSSPTGSSQLRDMAQSDTIEEDGPFNEGEAVPESLATVTDAFTRQARSQDIIDVLTPGNRYREADNDTLLGNIIYKHDGVSTGSSGGGTETGGGGIVLPGEDPEEPTGGHPADPPPEFPPVPPPPSGEIVVGANTYIVDPVFGSNSNDGQSAPWRTIAYALTQVVAGDTILLRGGTYDVRIHIDGLAGADWNDPITVSAYEAESAVIMPQTIVPGVSVVRFVNTCAYLQWLDIIFDGFYQRGTDTIGLTDPTNHHIRFLRCHMRNTGRVDGHEDGLSGHNTNGITIGGSNHELLQCLLYSNGYGAYMSGTGHLIELCEVFANYRNGIQKYPSGDNITFSKDIFRGNGLSGFLGLPSGRGEGLGIYGGTGNVVKNCISYGNFNNGFSSNYGETGSFWYFNTAFGNGRYGWDIGAESSGMTIRNNIAWLNALGAILDLGASTTASHNITSNPLFVDQANGNFHLLAGSPAIAAALHGTGILDDFDGVLRGNPPDAGALEFVA